MEIATLARPYAEALFQVAKKDDLAKWESILAKLAALGSNVDVQKMASHPGMKDHHVADMILSLAKVEITPEIENFVALLVENDRVKLLPEISAQFNSLKNISEGQDDAYIVSAFPMNEKELDELLVNLEKRFFRKLKAKAITVDPELIGGVIINVGDEVLDMSVRAKLNNMYKSLVVD